MTVSYTVMQVQEQHQVFCPHCSFKAVTIRYKSDDDIILECKCGKTRRKTSVHELKAQNMWEDIPGYTRYHEALRWKKLRAEIAATK